MTRTRLALVALILLLALALGRAASARLGLSRDSLTVPPAIAFSAERLARAEASEAAARRLLYPTPTVEPTDSLPDVAAVDVQPTLPPQPTVPPSPAPSSAQGATVTTETLNVRSGPGTQFDILTQVHKGERLTLLSPAAAWPQIRTATGVVGYVSAAYLRLDNGLSSSSVPAQGLPNLPPGEQAPPLPSNPVPNRPPSSAPGSDDGDNSVRVSNQTGGAYTFDTQEFMRLLRDEGIAAENISVTLIDTGFGNRSATTWGDMTVDCNPIQVPVDPSRPAPPGNGKTGAAFCNAVALHESYHLITLARAGWGGAEPDADAFASQRLKKYTLVR